MTGYVRPFESNTTMSFKISDKQLLKKYSQIWKSVEKLLKIEFDSKVVYGDDDKYIKNKNNNDGGSMFTNFQGKRMPKEKAPCNINNNARFCYQSKEKVASTNTLGRM